MSQDNEQDPGIAHQGPSFEPPTGAGQDQSTGPGGYSSGVGGYEPRPDGHQARRSAEEDFIGDLDRPPVGEQFPPGSDGAEQGGRGTQPAQFGSPQGHPAQGSGHQPSQGVFGAQYGGHPAQQGGYGQQYGGYGTQGYPPVASIHGGGSQGQPGGYGQQYGGYETQAYQPVAPIYGGYGNHGPRKSKATAALLAFLVGGLGAHDFYLGKRNLGLIHVGLGVGGFVIIMISAILAGTSGNEDSLLFLGVLPGYLMLLANGLWAFIEFIMILAKPEEELGR